MSKSSLVQIQSSNLCLCIMCDKVMFLENDIKKISDKTNYLTKIMYLLTRTRFRFEIQTVKIP